MKKSKYILALSLIVLWAPFAHAATVYLKDGSLIKGTIVSATAQDIQVNTEDGLIKIKAERILRVNYTDDTSQSPSPQTSQTSQTPQAAPPPPEPVSAEPSEEPAPPVRYARHRRYVRRSEPVPDEPENTNQIFSLNFGFASPLSRVDFSSTGGGSDNNGNTGIVIGGQYLYQTTSRLAWGMNLEYMNRGLSDSQSLLPSANTDVSGDSLVIMPVVKFSLVDRGGIRPYVLAGIGTNRTSTFIEAQPQQGFAWNDTNTDETRTLVNDSRWGLATTARVGIDFMSFNPSFFSLEIGWTGISNGSYGATQAGQALGLNSVTGNLSLLNIAGRWGWKF